MLSRHQRIEHAERELMKLGQKLHRRRERTHRAIRAAVRQLLKRTRTERFVQVTVKRQTQFIHRRLRRGRPWPQRPVEQGTEDLLATEEIDLADHFIFAISRKDERSEDPEPTLSFHVRTEGGGLLIDEATIDVELTEASKWKPHIVASDVLAFAEFEPLQSQPSRWRRTWPRRCTPTLGAKENRVESAQPERFGRPPADSAADGSGRSFAAQSKRTLAFSWVLEDRNWEALGSFELERAMGFEPTALGLGSRCSLWPVIPASGAGSGGVSIGFLSRSSIMSSPPA